MLDHEQIFSKLSPKGKPSTKEDDEQQNSTLVVFQEGIPLNKESEICIEYVHLDYPYIG